MKTFIVKIVLFTLPLLFYVLFVIIIDPYEYFGISEFVSHKIKKQTSNPINRRLWKVVAFKNNPCDNILLGDSRVDGLDVRKIEQLTGEKYFNFAYGGGTVPDVIDTFWYVESKVKLKRVYIGVNFSSWNDYYGVKSVVSKSIKISENPLLYFSSNAVLKASYYNIYSKLTDKTITIDHPTVNKEEFWKYKLETTAREAYSKYSYPDEYLISLNKIASYCDMRGIQLIFIILPTHVDLQKRVADFKLEEQEKRFKQDVKKLGPTYDFDYPNEITTNKYYFDDPFHSNVHERIIGEIWGKDLNIARYSNNKNR